MKIPFNIILLIYLFSALSGQSNAYSDSLLNALKASNDSVKAEIYNALAWKNRNTNPLLSLEYSNNAIDIAEKNNNTLELVRAYRYHGIAHNNIGNTIDALESFQIGLSKAIDKHLPEQIAYAYINIGRMLIDQQNMQEASIYLYDALIAIDSLNDNTLYSYTYLHLGRLYLYEKQFELAENYLNKAIYYKTIISDKVGLASCYKYLGEVSGERGNFDKALDYFHEGLSYVDSLQNPITSSAILVQVAKTYNRQKKYKQSMSLTYRVIDIASKTNAKETLIEAYQELVISYIALGNYFKATGYQKKILESKDEMFKVSLDYNIQHFKNDRVRIKEMAELDVLRSENMIHEIRIHNQKIIINLFVLLSILILSILILVIYFNQKNKKSDKIIRQQNKELQEANNAINRFFTIIAHDLKSPFNSAIGISNLLISKDDSMTAEKRMDMLQVLNNSLKGAYNFLLELLEWSASHLNSFKVNKEKIQLYQFINNIKNDLNDSAITKEIEISNTASAEIEINCDINITKTIIRNILANAIKFTPRKGNIIIEASQNEEGCLINIKDNGIGISKEKLNQIFNKNIQTSTEGTEKEIGSGLGLQLCIDLAKKQGGYISAESKPKKGSTFTLFIPKE